MFSTAIYQLSNDDLQAMLGDLQIAGELQVVDVRTDEEHQYLGYIPRALLIPLHTLPERYKELDKSQKTVLVCEHGVRSMDASAYLCHLGFQSVYNLTHGMASWAGARIRPAEDSTT